MPDIEPLAVAGGIALFAGLGIALVGMASFAGEKLRRLFKRSRSSQRAGAA